MTAVRAPKKQEDHQRDLIGLNGSCLRLPADIGTLAGFRAWAQSDDCPEKGKFSLINGNILIHMSPEEIETHTKVTFAIGHGVTGVNEEDDLGEYFADGVLLTNTKAELATVPDGTFVKWGTSQAARVQFIPRKDRQGQYIELRGTPDWVLEVVSLSSVTKDTIDLPVLYHRAGIPEFWLVDARGKGIDFQILVRGRSKYARAEIRSGWSFSPAFSRWFRLVRKRNRQGRWNYRLENRT
jgi:Uma2 family endonuclease